MRTLIFLMVIPLFTYSQTGELGSISTNQIVFEGNTELDLNNLEVTFLNVAADLHFNVDGDDFLLLPGTIPSEGPPAPTILMKKNNGEWNLHQIYDQVLMKAPRNIKIINENEFVIGDSGEHGNQPWLGNIWWGKITSSGIDWTKVNDDNQMGYFHGVSMGDLNNDDLIDFAGVPSTSADGVTWYTYGIFIQNNDGTFTRNNDFWIPENDMPFTIDIDNVLGDDRNEIITASYGGSSSGWNDDANRIEVYSYDENTQSYQLEFRSDQIDDFGQQVLGATSIISQDFNNDGIKDISVAREFFAGDIDGDGNDDEDLSFNSFEVWLSDGIGGFNLSYNNVFPFDELRFREFVVLDANQDGNLDIVLRTNGGTDYFSGDLSGNPDTYWDEIQRAITLNKSIWLGNGAGTFDFYNSEELRFEMENYSPSVINPFMRDDKLCFLGSQNTYQNNNGNLEIDMIDIEIDLNYSNLSYDTPRNSVLTIYPNPSSSFVKLNSDKEYDIELYDMIGNKLMALTGNFINIEHLSTATYIVKAIDKSNNKKLTFKIVKN